METPVTKFIKIGVMKDRQTKLQIVKTLGLATGLDKKQIMSVFTSLSDLIAGHINKKGSGTITIPEVGIKVICKDKKATKARTMTSPLTGEEIHIAAKKARKVVKLSALKVLKEMVN